MSATKKTAARVKAEGAEEAKNQHEARVAERQAHELDLVWSPDRIPVTVRKADGSVMWEGEMQARTDLGMEEQEILNRVLGRLREHQEKLRKVDIDDETDEGIEEFERVVRETAVRMKRIEWQILKIALIDFPREVFDAMSDHQRNLATEEFFQQAGATQSTGNPTVDALLARNGRTSGPKLQSIRTLPKASGVSNGTTPGSLPDSSTTTEEASESGTP